MYIYTIRIQNVIIWLMPGHLRCTICHLAHSTPQRRESLYFVTKNFDPALYFSKTLTLRCISQKTFTLVCVSQKLWPYSLDLSNPGLYFPKTLTLVCISQKLWPCFVFLKNFDPSLCFSNITHNDLLCLVNFFQGQVQLVRKTYCLANMFSGRFPFMRS